LTWTLTSSFKHLLFSFQRPVFCPAGARRQASTLINPSQPVNLFFILFYSFFLRPKAVWICLAPSNGA